MTACWTECTPSLVLKQWNTNLGVSDWCGWLCSVLLFAACWLSSTKLAEHWLSQENKELWASLASQRGWGTAAGVWNQEWEGHSRHLLLELLSCNVQQWPQQRGCGEMWFVGCCKRSVNLIVLFRITYLCLGLLVLLGVAELVSLCF